MKKSLPHFLLHVKGPFGDKPWSFSFGSEHAKARFLHFVKQNPGLWYVIQPQKRESKKQRGYLEGGVIPAYCEWQYGIDARDRSPQTSETRRFLFKRDFNGEVIKDRHGDPVIVPTSTKGVLNEVTTTYTEWATENGAPIPNTELFKMWRDEYSTEFRFPTFFDFLDFLGVECDAMPSSAMLKKLKPKNETKERKKS